MVDCLMKPLRYLLSSKYLYSDDMLRGSVNNKVELNRLVKTDELFEIRTRGQRPFLLAAAGGNLTELAQIVCSYALETSTIGIAIVSNVDATTLEIYKRNFEAGKFERITDLEYYFRKNDNNQLLLLEELVEYNEVDAMGLKQFPITNKLENIFFEVHSAMRDIDGLHADGALEELCKVLYTKYYSEEHPNNNEGRIHSSEFGSTEEFAAALRGLYEEAIDYDMRVFRLKIPQYERSRGVFREPIKLSSAALNKSFQLLENYSLGKSGTDIKGRAFQKVLGKAIRSGMGQYFTPSQIGEFIVSVVQPKIQHLILDPFCGSGHFLSLSLRYISNETSVTSKEFHEFAFGKLHGIEKSDRMTRIAMTDMRLQGDGHSNIRCSDALLPFENYPDIAPDSFDVIMTNPPFGSLLSSNALAGLGHFELARSRKNIPLELLGLERALQFLRPGGRLAIVLPDSVFNADSNAFVRRWLTQKTKIRGIVSLPIETFSPFGANVRTGILFARKWKIGETVDDNYPVCVVKVESVGYDASGRQKSDQDLTAAAEQLNGFIKTNGW